MSLEDELRRQQQQVDADANTLREQRKNSREEADRQIRANEQMRAAESRIKIADENRRLQEILSKSGIEIMVQEIVNYARANNFYRGRKVGFKEVTDEGSLWERLKGAKARTFFGIIPDIEEGDVLEPVQLQITRGGESSPFWRADISWSVAGPMLTEGGDDWGSSSHTYRSSKQEGFAVKASPYGIQIGGTPYAKEIIGAEFHGPSNPKALESALIAALTGKPLA